MKQSNVLLVCEYLRVNLRLFYFLKEFMANRCKKNSNVGLIFTLTYVRP